MDQTSQKACAGPINAFSAARLASEHDTEISDINRSSDHDHKIDSK